MNPKFSYIRARRPKVGMLVRNTGFGSRVSIVTNVTKDRVWLRGYEFQGRRIEGMTVVWPWHYKKRTRQRMWLRKDYVAGEAFKTTGPRYWAGGYWMTNWHRPCKRN